MTRSSMRSRRANRVVALLLLGAGWSCVKSAVESGILPPPKTTAETEDDTLSSAPAHLGGNEDPAGLPERVKNRATPTLTKSIDSMTESEIVAYFKLLQFDRDVRTTQTVDARCRHLGGGPCGTGDSAHVFMQPEVGMHKWSNSAIPASGLIVGRIINYSPAGDDEYTFHFPGHERTWWIVDRVGGALRSRYFVRTHNAATPIRFVTLDHYGFRECTHDATVAPNLEAKAKFSDCARSLLPVGGFRGDRLERGTTNRPAIRGVSYSPGSSVVPLPARPLQALLTATWVTCDVGCCATS